VGLLPGVPFQEVPARVTSGETLSDTSVVHAIPGRIRLRVKALKAAPGLAGCLEAFLKTQPGMKEVSVNSWCHSVTVTCDPSHWTADTLCTFLQSMRSEDIERYELKDTDSVTTPWIDPLTCWTVMGYVTLVLGIILFLLPMVPGGLPFLLLSRFCFSRVTALTLPEASIAG
jgi:hypothetical protein